MRFLFPTVHGIIDYLIVVFLLVSPYLFDIAGLPAAIIYVLAGVHLLITMATAYTFGVFKVLPFRIHGYIELVVAFILVPLPWLLNFEQVDEARNYFICLGIGLFALWFLTRYRPIFEKHKGEPKDVITY